MNNHQDIQRHVLGIGLNSLMQPSQIRYAMQRVLTGEIEPSYYNKFPGLEKALQRYKDSSSEIQGIRDEAYNQISTLSWRSWKLV